MTSVIRPAKEGDVTKLIGFFKEMYRPEHITTGKDYLMWQYRDAAANRFYPDYSNLLLFDGEEIAGHLGLIPYVFEANGRKMKGAYLASGILRKDLYGTGAGALLIKEAEKYFDLLYTTGYNQRIAPIYKLHNWSEEYFLKRWIYNNSGSAEVKNNPQIYKIQSFDHEWDAVWEKLKNNYKITIDRSGKYLNWRFKDNPFVKYAILYAKSGGYIVLRKEDGDEFKACRIVDFIAGPDCALELLCAAIDFIKKDKIDFLDFFCSSDMHGEALERAGFEIYNPEINPEPPIFILPADRARTKINFIYKFINPGLSNYKFQDWFVVKADGDKDRPSKNYVK